MTKEFLVTSASRSSRPKYVLKRVSEEKKYENKERYLKGCIDLALETKFLSSLNHPNILDVRAVSSVGPFNEGYFIIIDRLKETLPKRISGWITIDRQTKGVTGIFAGGKKKVDRLVTDRLSVAFEIASAMGYLHERRIIYRDLVRSSCNYCQ
jgi:serine/threonine protein kinase